MLNLIQINERLKKQPDDLIIAAANGRIPSVPPFMASAELLRRKQMREEAAATQNAEMEGAPTVTEELAQEVATPRQAKEQIAGLMALQGNRQQQAARQQAGIQSAMPMAAPNTTTSEPAQLAGGGFIDDIVVPRDFQAGGPARMDPTMLKKLALMRSMKNKARPGLPSLPVNMFRRADYANGGIVAFAGPEGSFVESRPGFYELAEEVPEDKTEEEIRLARLMASLPPEARGVLQLAKQIRERSTPEAIAQRRRAAGLPATFEEAADTSAKLREELARQKAEFQAADTITNRVLALQPGQFKTGITGRSMAEYDKNRMAKAAEINKAIATADDLRSKAKNDFAENRFKEGEAALAAADKAEMDALNKAGELKYRERLGSKADEGTNLDKVYKTELAALIAEGKDPNDPRTQREAMRRAAAFVTYAGPRVDVQSQALIATNERAALEKYQELFKGKNYLISPLADDMDAAAARDKKEGTGTKYQDQVRLREYNRIRESLQLPPVSVLPGGTAAPQAPAAPAAPAAPTKGGFYGREIGKG